MRDGTRARAGTTSRLRWGVTAGCTAVLLGASASTAPLVLADETPQQALQALSVQLGTDGSITALTSDLVSRGEDGAQTRSRALDPGESAADLPVRVTTSWRHDGRVGTDLADVVGASGRVEVSVTVQNTTVRPERFQYDSGGVARDRYELVTTPLTVVARAALPQEAGASLVRPPNGVVSTDGAATTVQWASLLAPPRLSASTTFTLVQDTEDFQLPEIALAVQPGLATDTSIASLVGTTFGGSAERVASENNTIALIAGVNVTLAEVADSLHQVRETLSTNAGQVGAAATESLDRTADAVDAAAQSVLADLQALDDSVGATVRSSNTQAVTALRTSVQGVLDYFGTPTAPKPSAPAAASCGAEQAAEAPAPTLLGQLSTVSRQLRDLGAASGDCVEDLRTTLRDSIGEAADCADDADTLVCRLQGAGTELATIAGDLVTDGDAVLAELGAVGVEEIGPRITALVSAVQELQTTGSGVGSLLAGGPDAEVVTAFDDLAAGLEDVLAGTDPDATDGIAAQLQDLADLAQDRLDELQGTDGIGDQLADLATAVCALDVADGTEAEADAVSRLVNGEDCAGTEVGTGSTTYPAALTDRIAAEADAWGEVRDAADADDPTSLAGRLAAVHTQLGDLDDQVADLRALVESGGRLGTEVADLLDDLTAVYDATPASWTCATPPAVTGPALNALAASWFVADCNQDSVAASLRSLLDEAANGVRTTGAEQVTDAAHDAEAAGTAADTSLDGLSEALAQRLGEAADRQMEQGRAVVAAQQAQLAAAQAAAERELDATAQESVGRLAAQVAAANQQQSAAAAALQVQLEKVLVDLGSARDGRGLLGVMQNSAGQTGVRTDQVQHTSRTAASFGGVRMTELADAQLEQQQLVRALQSADTYDAFTEDLPKGSTSSTVFTFRLGGEN
jgi:trimeric autotransporter adhesin